MDIKNNLCKLKYIANITEENEEEDEDIDTKMNNMILESVELGFTSEGYNTTILEKGEDDIIKTEKMSITLTTTDNQKNNINNN